MKATIAGKVAADRPSISRSESWTIDFIRIVCIFFMIWVHVFPGIREPSYVYHGPAHLLWVVTTDVMGRASVATLSFFSGYVLYIQTASRAPTRIIADRFRSIYVPMVTWNVIAFAVTWMGLAVLDRNARTVADFFDVRSVWDYASLLLALDRQPANLPIGFLRDLFVTIVLLTLLRGFIVRWGVLLLALLVPLAAFDATAPVVLRPSITLFALAGFIVASLGWTLTELAAPSRALPAIGLFGAAYLVSAHSGIAQPVLAEEIPNLTKRAALVGVMLFVGSTLASRWSSIPVHGTRTVLFVTFLSHGIVAEVLGEGYEVLGGSVRSPAYLIFFFATPFLMLTAGAVASRVIDRFPGWAQIALRGTSSGKNSLSR